MYNVWHVWSESASGGCKHCTGYNDNHTLGRYHGSASGPNMTFKEACERVFFDEITDRFDPLYNQDTNTYWALKLFHRIPQYV